MDASNGSLRGIAQARGSRMRVQVSGVAMLDRMSCTASLSGFTLTDIRLGERVDDLPGARELSLLLQR
jgi:hypothetical protein